MRALIALLPLALFACSGGSSSGDDTDSDGASADPNANLPKPSPPADYSGGTCPKIKAGTMSGFESNGTARKFQVALPPEPQGAGLIFFWHGNGDTGTNFAAYLNASKIAKKYNLIVFTPEKGAGGIGLDWGVPPSNEKADLTFFDDMLSCADQQYNIDRRRVYTLGFSAGALFSSFLTLNRADHLAGAVIFSGGSDGGVSGVGGGVNDYVTPAWDIPVLMTEGGPNDQVIINFHDMTENMSTKLRADGSTVIVCHHTQGHTPPSGFDAYVWPFLDAEVFGQAKSPYADGQDPSGEIPDMCVWD